MKCQIFLFCSFFALIAVGNAQDDKEDKDPIDAVPSTAPSSFPSIKPSVDGNNSTETSDVPTDSPVDSEEVTLSPTASEDPDPPPPYRKYALVNLATETTATLVAAGQASNVGSDLLVNIFVLKNREEKGLGCLDSKESVEQQEEIESVKETHRSS
eukprot:CAMPEP_0201116546 /NCGR_PEP_ID=MMETSP0850-20130426/789_1 /ASSEMBLY_ACC=CAM_ASM_000622 /TAXON_ID=183588 /ORGANISM="Pseudo-nitzschia fraudulenta, Strain WWA7" /LENGTH=155 /DNA_ID=CAMNT_0047380647 /DNA_START=230 /DNA_END=698 /DNA_ORIENTATION=-